MKKIGIALVLSLPLCNYGDQASFLKRITKQAKIPKFIINLENIQLDHTTRFQNEFRVFNASFRPLYRLLEEFNTALAAYSKQPIAYQEEYRNAVQFDTLINTIRQKDLVIALTKLLQYKTSSNNPDEKQSSDLIEKLKKLIQSIEWNLARLASNKDLFIQFIDNPPAEIAQLNIADYFKNVIAKQFFLRIKKIKRSITNWENK